MVGRPELMINVHFIIHEAFESPGAYEVWAQKRNYTITYSRVFAGDPLPQKIDKLDFLIVMGGPQSPATSLEDCPHFDASKEIALIHQFISVNKPVIGVCLGAQLMGEAFGAKFENSPFIEIGHYPITLTKEASENKLFAHFPKVVNVGHWHGDMPGLLTESKVIATSQGCPRQIIQYSDRAYGFQCHMEFTLDVVEQLIDASREELKTLSGGKFIQSPEVLQRNDYAEMNVILYRFLDNLADKYLLE